MLTMKIKKLLYISCFFCVAGSICAQTQNQQPQKSAEKPKMQFMGAYDGGQPGVSIYKLFDPTDDVVCYVLTPEIAGRKQQDGVWIYEGNSAGSISCLKVRVQVVPVGPSSSSLSPSSPIPKVKIKIIKIK